LPEVEIGSRNGGGLVLVFVVLIEGGGSFRSDRKVKGIVVDAIHERLDVVMA
jgi:hypothetical protein